MAQTYRPKSLAELNEIIQAHRQKQVVNRAKGLPPLLPLKLVPAPLPKTPSEKAVEKWRRVWGGIAQ